MSDDRKKMTVKDFRAAGYLQELNRQFLHPLGLALEVVRQANGEERFGLVWDSREDSQGFAYGPDTIEIPKAIRVEREMEDKRRARQASLGYYIQPYSEDRPPIRSDQLSPQQLRTLNALVTYAAENIPGGLVQPEREVAQIIGNWVLEDKDVTAS